MDRTVATGTGYIGQYPPPVAGMYESLKTCPDELLLFMHHVPYTYVLHSGRTVIQHIYDSHYQGAATAQGFPRQWSSLRHRIDGARYRAVLARLEYQAGHAIVWRDFVCNWFLRKSSIPDAKGRVGHYPNRFEAEAMQLDGYVVENIQPREAASDGKAIACAEASRRCRASFRYHGNPGWYDVTVQYFDQNDGVSQFRLFVADQLVDEWAADDHLSAKEPNSDSSTRRKVIGLALRPGDVIRVEGVPDGKGKAVLELHRD